MGIGMLAALKSSGHVRTEDAPNTQNTQNTQAQRPKSSDTSAYDKWLAQRYPKDPVFAATAHNPAAARVALDAQAKDDSLRFRADELYGLLFAEDADASCATAVLPLIQYAYAECSTFRRLFNHHVDASAGALYRLRGSIKYSTTVTAKQIDAAGGHEEMTFSVDAEGVPQAWGYKISALRAMMHELVHALTRLRDDPGPDNSRGAVVEYCNIILAELYGEPARATYGPTHCCDDGQPEGVGESLSKDAQAHEDLYKATENTVQGWRVAAMESINRFSTAESDALRELYPSFDDMRKSASPSDFAQIYFGLTKIRAESAAPSAGLTKACETFAEKAKEIEKNWELKNYRLAYLQQKIVNEEEKASACMLYARAGEHQQQAVDTRKQQRRAEEAWLKEQAKTAYQQQSDDRRARLLQEERDARAFNPSGGKVAVEVITHYGHTTHSAQVLRDPHGRTLTGAGAAKPPLNETPGKNSAETPAETTDTNTASGMTQVARVDAPVRHYTTVTETRKVEPNWRGQIRPHQLQPYAGEGNSTVTYVEERRMLPQGVEASREHIMHTERLDTSYRVSSGPGVASKGAYSLLQKPHVTTYDTRYAGPQVSQVSQVSQRPQVSQALQPASRHTMSAASALSPPSGGAIEKRSSSAVVKRPFPFPPSPSSSPSPSRSPSQPSSSSRQPATEADKRARQRIASPVWPAPPAVAERLPAPPSPMVFHGVPPAPQPQPYPPPPPGSRLATLVDQLRGTTWDGDAIDLAVSLLVRLPEWPQNLILIIEDEARRLSNALLPPGNRCFAQVGGACHGERIRQLLPRDMVNNAIRVQRVLLNGMEHFDAIIDGLVKKVAPDGDCFFRAALASTNQIHPCNILKSDVMRLRNQSADYLQQHAAEFADFFGATESQGAMRVQGMSLDSQMLEKIKLRPTPLDEQRKKIIEARIVAALQKWQDMTDKQRLDIGIDSFMRIHKLTRPGDRNFFCLSGLMPRGQTYLDRLTGVLTNRISRDHLIEWRDMHHEQREQIKLRGFIERYKLNPSTCQRYMCKAGLTTRGVAFLAGSPKRTRQKVTFDILKNWWNMTLAARMDKGVEGYAQEVGLNVATLKNRISLKKGIRSIPTRFSHLRLGGEDGSSRIARAEQTAPRTETLIPETPTETPKPELIAACLKWLGMTRDQRFKMSITGFVKENKLFGRHDREHFCMSGMKVRGRGLLDKHAGVKHVDITLAPLQEWAEMTQAMRDEIGVVGFAQKNRLNAGSTVRYMSAKGLTSAGKSLYKKLINSSKNIPALLRKWEAMTVAEREGCKGVKGFATQNNVSPDVMGNYIFMGGLRPRGKIHLARHPAGPDIVTIKTEPAEPMEAIVIVNSHTYRHDAPYSRHPDNPERSLKSQRGKKLKIELNRDLQSMLDEMPDDERLKITESIHDQVRQWIRDEGDVAAAQMKALMEVVDPVDDGPKRGLTVFALENIKQFQVIGCYGGKELRFDDGSYERACREHGEANIAAYAFGLPDPNALRSAYRAGNILSMINSAHLGESKSQHPEWLQHNNLRACSAGKDIVFFIAIEDIEAGKELLLPYGETYKMYEPRPTVVKTEIDDDAQPDVSGAAGADVGVSVADIEAYADTLDVRIKGRKGRGGKTLLAATELTFLRRFQAEAGEQYALFNQRTGWHLLDQRPAGTEALPPRYQYLAPLISLSTQVSTQQRFEGQYYFYFARHDVYLPVAPTAISTKWRVQSPDGKDTDHLLEFDGVDKVWCCGAIVLTGRRTDADIELIPR